jgi:Uma2 family endonuclease
MKSEPTPERRFLDQHGGQTMATTQPILRLGKTDEGRLVSSDEFAEAEFDEPWKYEREDGKLIVLAPSGEGHLYATVPWRDDLIFYRRDRPDIVQLIATEAWIRVNDGTDRIGDIGVYFQPTGPVPKIPDRVPDMMFEIVSPDKVSRDRDYVRKRAEYHALGVREYVIIDRFQKTVTVLTFAPDGYDERILTIGETYVSPLLPGFSIRLSDVFPN